MLKVFTDGTKFFNCSSNKGVVQKDISNLQDVQLNFSADIQTPIKKANKILGIIKRTFSFLDVETFFKIIQNKTMIRPHFKYANTGH